MPVEIDLGMPPAGYAAAPKRATDTTAAIQFREFTSTEDGQHFIRRLEGFPNDILEKLPTPTSASQVDHLLALCHRDGTATVYLNELELRASVRWRGARSVDAGEPVTRNDFVDVERLELGVQVPKDVGALFVFSVGWRKGLFYDFGPVGGPSSRPREEDISVVLGRCYCHVLFQERFRISDSEWDQLLKAQWFPFAALRAATIDKLLNYMRSGWEPDELLDDIVVEVRETIPRMLQDWRSHSSFKPHIDILGSAVERFRNDDYIPCTGLLYPRIEGILRTHLDAETRNPTTQKKLVQAAVSSKLDNEQSALLPHRFRDYLREVYFADFSPASKDDAEVSRNSVAHGTASASKFNRKSAVIGILIVHQLFYFLENRTNGASPNESS